MKKLLIIILSFMSFNQFTQELYNIAIYGFDPIKHKIQCVRDLPNGILYEEPYSILVNCALQISPNFGRTNQWLPLEIFINQDGTLKKGNDLIELR